MAGLQSCKASASSDGGMTVGAMCAQEVSAAQNASHEPSLERESQRQCSVPGMCAKHPTCRFKEIACNVYIIATLVAAGLWAAHLSAHLWAAHSQQKEIQPAVRDV